jgi:hypothetical protein
MTSRRYIGIVLRLALVAGLLAGAVEAARVYVIAIDDRARTTEIKSALECAALKPDEELRRAATSPGANFDLGKVGCANRQFWAADYEVDAVRRGSMTWVDAKTSFFQPWRTAEAAMVWFVLVSLVGAGFWGVFMTLRWIWGRSS